MEAQEGVAEVWLSAGAWLVAGEQQTALHTAAQSTFCVR